MYVFVRDRISPTDFCVTVLSRVNMLQFSASERLQKSGGFFGETWGFFSHCVRWETTRIAVVCVFWVIQAV